MPEQRPFLVGRIVPYVSHGTPVRSDGSQAYAPACRAAIVTEVGTDDPGRVGLAVLNPTGPSFHPLAAGGCVHSPAGTQLGGSWHWPEAV
ncbi:hypothetical protein [Streptomyces chattanoogensis]|uniref:Uncharacterized protein n=1 Tax=Streptomyces chattanoogensis TaxID=66876 RepID=A0A0N0GVV0_9ACTN|nr:hypothetical protein [Streptomyces chattanoogensis]KPC59522.1 hypothetical protein ADL29_34360 [Streptomyces chattanoogensis]